LISLSTLREGFNLRRSHCVIFSNLLLLCRRSRYLSRECIWMWSICIILWDKISRPHKAKDEMMYFCTLRSLN
jgi:hypothetical protein